MAKPRVGRVGGVLMNASSCRQLAPALVVAVPSLLLYALAMGWMYYDHYQQPTAMLSISTKSKMVQKVYAEDEARGQAIIREMDGKVANPLWVKLVKNKKIRGAFAAALGSAASGGGDMAFDIGNMLSGLPGSGSSHGSSTMAPSAVHEETHGKSLEQPLTPHLQYAAQPTELHKMPVRAVVAARKAKVAQQMHAKPHPMQKTAEGDFFHPSSHHSVPIVYNAFAPGVLAGTAAPHHEQAHITPPAPKAKPAVSVQDVKKNLEKVTGFADNYAPDTSAEAKLSHKVEELKKENAAAHAKLLANQKAEEAKRLKLLKKVEATKASNSAKEVHEAAAAKQPTPRFDGHFADFVGGKAAAKAAGETDKRVFHLLKAVEHNGHAPASSPEKKQQSAEEKHASKEAAEAAKLMAEIEQHAAIISSPAHDRVSDPLETVIGKIVSGKRLPVHDAGEGGGGGGHEKKHGKQAAKEGGESGDPQEALYRSVDGVRDWRALAKKSKALAAAHGKGGGGGGASTHAVAHRQQQLRHHDAAASKWITKVKKGPLPYECGMPLVAEASGFNCNKVMHVRRVPGNNHILHDIEDVGLGDSKERSGDLQPQEELVPSVHVTPAQAIKALGYSNAHQYERHALLKTIAKEEDRIQAYKAKEAGRHGGLGRLARHRHRVESKAATRHRLEREIQREEGEVRGYEHGIGLGGMALKHALSDDVGHLGDRQVPVGAESGDLDLGLAREG